MILTYELDLYWAKVNHRAEYLGQRSFRSKVIVRTHTYTHTHNGPFALPGPLTWSVKMAKCYGNAAEMDMANFLQPNSIEPHPIHVRINKAPVSSITVLRFTVTTVVQIIYVKFSQVTGCYETITLANPSFLASILDTKTSDQTQPTTKWNKNSSGDEIANVNFYAVRPEATRIRWNNAK